MRFAFAGAFLVGLTAATISPNDGSDKGIHSVGVYCKGLQTDTLSAKALSFTAKALEETYNLVHGATKDVATAKVVANGPLGSVTANSLRGGAATKGLGFTMVGGWHCKMCRNDDDDAAAVNMIRQAEWETEFAAVLAKAPYGALSNVQDCTIDYDEEDQSTKAVFRSNFDIQKDATLVIDVKCDGADFSDLTVHALAAASKALKESYNAAHGAIDGDKASLESVQIEGPRVFSGLDFNVHGWHCKMCRNDDELAEHNLVFTAVSVGGWHCKMCRNDDSETTRDDEHKLATWEKLFLETLQGEPAFKQVGQCKINVSAAIQAS